MHDEWGARDCEAVSRSYLSGYGEIVAGTYGWEGDCDGIGSLDWTKKAGVIRRTIAEAKRDCLRLHYGGRTAPCNNVGGGTKFETDFRCALIAPFKILHKFIPTFM